MPAIEPKNFSGTYELDVDTITSTEFGTPETGTLIISHNAMAIFPIDLSAKKKILHAMGRNTILEIQTKFGCEGNGRTELDSSHHFVRSIGDSPDKKDVADITNLKITMPYYATQDKWRRTPASVCAGFRIKDKGWVWHFTSVVPSLDEVNKIGFTEIKVNETNVDAVAILFETTTIISKISFEVK